MTKTSQEKIEHAKKMIATGGYGNVQLTDNQVARLMADLDFTPNEIIIETGIYINE